MNDLLLRLALVAALTATPTPPAPAPMVAAPPLDPLHQIVQQAAWDNGVSSVLLDCIVTAESHYDPRAVSPTSDRGLGQIHVFADGSSLLDVTPWAGGDLFDARTNAEATAWLIGHGYGPRWSTWWGCQ